MNIINHNYYIATVFWNNSDFWHPEMAMIIETNTRQMNTIKTLRELIHIYTGSGFFFVKLFYKYLLELRTCFHSGVIIYMIILKQTQNVLGIYIHLFHRF
jgi:hypothetical protein